MQFAVPKQIAYNSRYSQGIYIDESNLDKNKPQIYLSQLANLNSLSYNSNYVAKDLNVYPYDVITNTTYFIIEPGILLIDTVFINVNESCLIDISNANVSNPKYIIITAHFNKNIDVGVVFKANFLDNMYQYVDSNSNSIVFDDSHTVCIGIFKMKCDVNNIVDHIYHNNYDSTFDYISQKLININAIMDKVRYLKIVLDSDIKLRNTFDWEVLNNTTWSGERISKKLPLAIFDELDWSAIFKLYGRWYSSSKNIYPQSIPFRNSFQRRLNITGVFQ